MEYFNYVTASIENIYGDASVDAISDAFLSVMSDAITEAEETAKRLYESVQPVYDWADQKAKATDQKFVDKDKMWEAIKAVSIGGGRSDQED